MAREFSGTGQYLTYSGGLGITANDTIWMSFWFYPTSTATMQMFCIGTLGTGANRYSAAHVKPTGRAQQVAADGTTISWAGNQSITQNAWNHIIAEYSGTNLRAHRLNGGTRQTDTIVTITQDTAPNGIRIGASMTAGNLVIGRMAYCAIFAGSPTVQDATDLSGGGVIANAKHPTLAASAANLLAYWDLDGNDSPEPDGIGSADMVLTGSPIQAASPGIILPSGGGSTAVGNNFWWTF